MNREWTEEELEILRRDRAAGIPVPVTAAKLNRPVPATYLRARLIGTRVQRHRAWGEDEAARLRMLVTADPPMTDKRIAEELGRTVTQVRWKMQDLGLVGLRDLSRLAKATSSGSRRKQRVEGTGRPRVLPEASTAGRRASTASGPPEGEVAGRPQILAAALIGHAVARAAEAFEAALRASVATSEDGMVRAAMSAIAEKKAIDDRLAALAPRQGKVRNQVADAQQQLPAADARSSSFRRDSADERKIAVPRVPCETTPARRDGMHPEALVGRTAAIGSSRAPARDPVRTSPSPAPAARIVVLETPLPRHERQSAAAEQPQMSGRGGWKSVRRDPARAAAQSRSKPANRSDAIDLAQAAQGAIEQFIAERGVTRGSIGGTQALVTRLQARGYIVVSDADGWIIDQRHRVVGDKALEAFAAARGIRPEAAA